ncbi:OTU domain-containing protein 3 isoform X1 [Carcharodon carcharias]|uniref:OTU domain-containing protein 3 isoform X1 n=1 Tax=Carcharodon carcharias TaxID=13397 RepID=UPI001B7D93D7|nr:OTU domain-containing protein 3 isoform X1 [Carcharodon carcharias]
MSKKQVVKTRTNKKLDLERKRDEKAVRRALAKERKNRAQEGTEDEEFVSFANQLLAMGLKLREVPGDGNCLFRALGDQLEGHSRNHLKHRRETVDFMIKHRQDFEPFVEDDVPFDRYVANLEKPGTFVGNDAIVAFARNNQVNIVIHQLNAPLWQVFGTRKSNAVELHIAYRYGEHYDSVRMLNDNSEAPANLKTEMLIKDDSKKKDRNKMCHYQMEDIRDFESEMTKTDLDDAVQKVRNATGCMDTDMIVQNLEAENYNIRSVIFAILQMEELKNSNSDEESNKTSSNCSPQHMSPLWMENGTGNRIFGNQTVNSEEIENNRRLNEKEENKRTKNKVCKVTNKQRKEQQRLEKKKRQEERHRQKVIDSRSNNMEDNGTNRDIQAPVTLVKTFTTLNI